MNRARAAPSEEGRWLLDTGDKRVTEGIAAFGVDATQLTNDFAGYEARQPVAWSAPLAKAAERHALDLAATRTQAHRGSDGSMPAERVRAAGVNTSSLAETVSSHAWSPIFAHAAFQIDWGGAPPTGVQEWPRPGHRFAIMSAQPGATPSNTVGMKWLPVNQDDDNFGPSVLVQEFAVAPGTFVVGLVWRDRNSNHEFDLGEGISNVDVRLMPGTLYCLTASAGGFVLPIAPGTTSTIQFRPPGGKPIREQVRVTDANTLVNIELP